MAAAVTAIVLAAGAGTRMRSAKAKVLHEIGGRSLLGHALAAARGARPDQLVVVVGHQGDEVRAHALACDAEVRTAVQAEQNGTGHAVQIALRELTSRSGTVVVTSGDVPLLAAQTLTALISDQTSGGHAVSLLTAELPDPSGYGRVLRDDSGTVHAIREHRDASPDELSINEVNAGTYAFDADFLATALEQVGTDNAQGEVYLTDVIAQAVAQGRTASAVVCADVWETEGVNDRVQLARLGVELNRRTLEHWMRAGVTVVDPASTFVDVTVALAQDVTLLPGTQLYGRTQVFESAIVGPDTSLTDTTVGPGATVTRTHSIGAELGPAVTVGPFAYLRPGTRVSEGGKVGTFVETKNASLGPHAKVPHLSYVGDAEVGEGSNIGAGTIFANYDGVEKNSTVIGRHCKTGSDNVFVAPVRVGDGAVTGAGTVVRKDVPAGALAVSASSQRHLEGWVARKRPNSPGANAAAAADHDADT